MRTSCHSQEHCATNILLLKAAGHNDREVCFITGHTNAASLASYVKPTEKDCSSMAAVLDGDTKTKAIALRISARKTEADVATSPESSAENSASANSRSDTTCRAECFTT